MRRTSFLAMAACLWLTRAAQGQGECRFYLVNHASSSNGFTLSLKGQAGTNGVCPLGALNIELAVGDGTNFHHFSPGTPPVWQPGVVYTAQAVVTAAGPQQLFRDGIPLGTLSAQFQPAQEPFFGSLVDDSSGVTEGYLASQVSLQVTNGAESLVLVPNSDSSIPIPSLLMSGPAPWQAVFAEDPAQTTTITASFRFDSIPASTNQLYPFIDGFGQVTFSSWPGQASTTNDLIAAIAEEQNWLATNAPLTGLDRYGGSTLAGWTDNSSPYFHTALRNNRWWLVSPLGNPLFYVGLTGVFENVTPITGRESLFTNLPPATPDFAAAYTTNAWQDTQTTAYVSFDIANQIRKYGSGWNGLSQTQAVQRILSWGFGGVGKEGGLPGLPRNPILKHGSVTNVVQGGHPDTFNSNTVSQLTAALAAQIGSDLTNQFIIGWSVGNEKQEIIAPGEVRDILLLGASVSAKRALVDYALSGIYSNDLTSLTTAWNITNAASVSDVYVAPAVAPTNDVSALREHYQVSYYSNLYHTVKSIDSNHLYFGSWILAGNAEDWPAAAASCDVMGFDDFSPSLSQDLVARIADTRKPVILGAFSFPSDYLGMRGFGWANYTQATTVSDAASGAGYAQKVLSAAANPFVVGVEWFEYRDEPPCGRGNTDGSAYPPESLVVGENLAFGLVDVTDRPKYDLVNQVRAANVAALQGLGLLGPLIITTDSAFGVLSNQFGFNVAGQSGQILVVERSPDLVRWNPVQTNTLSTNPIYYGDSSVRRTAQHFYRARYQ